MTQTIFWQKKPISFHLNHPTLLYEPSKLEDDALKLLESLNIFIPQNESYLNPTAHKVESQTNRDRATLSSKAQELLIKNQMDILRNMNKTLNTLDKECEEENWEKFSEIARANARQILNAVYGEFPDFDYDIYPTEDKEVAINCTPYKGQGCLILCDSNGSVAYFASLAGKNSRFRCDRIDQFPYKNLWQIFGEFKKMVPITFAYASPSEFFDNALPSDEQPFRQEQLYSSCLKIHVSQLVCRRETSPDPQEFPEAEPAPSLFGLRSPQLLR